MDPQTIQEALATGEYTITESGRNAVPNDWVRWPLRDAEVMGYVEITPHGIEIRRGRRRELERMNAWRAPR